LGNRFGCQGWAGEAPALQPPFRRWTLQVFRVTV
jgi:hypothetical protein